MSDLKPIFEALVPENIKNIKVVKDAMSIFMLALEENAAVAFDIKNIYNQHLNVNVVDLTTKSKLNLRKALLNIYLKTMYEIIVSAQQNKAIQEKFSRNGITNAALNNAIEEILNEEYFATNKHFKETVGTVSAINQGHDVARLLENNPDLKKPTIVESKPFHMEIESSVSAELYHAVTAPLAHPAGFTYSYSKIVRDSLFEYFGIHKEFIVKSIEIRGSDGTFSVFSEIPTVNAATSAIWADFQTRINPLTGSLFTLTEFNAQVTIYANKVTKNITDMVNLEGRTITILFVDGTAVVQAPSALGNIILYVSNDTWIANGQPYNVNTTNGAMLGVFKSFVPSSTGHFSLFTDYTYTLVFDYIETVVSLLSWQISLINDRTGAAGGNFYLDHNLVPQPVGTSDVIKMTSQTAVTDTFIGYSVGTLGTTYASSTNLSYFTTAQKSLGFISSTFVQNTNTGVTNAIVTTESTTNINAIYTLTAAKNGDITVTSAGTTGTIGLDTFVPNTTNTIILTDGSSLSVTYGTMPAVTFPSTSTITVTGQEKYTIGTGANSTKYSIGTLSNAGTNNIQTYTFTETATTTSSTITVTNILGSIVGTISITSGLAITQYVKLLDNNEIQIIYNGAALVTSTAAIVGTLLTKQGDGFYLSFL